MEQQIERVVNQLAHKGVFRGHLSMGEIVVELSNILDEFVKVGEDIVSDYKVNLKSEQRIRLYNAIIKGGGKLF
uniref:Uncharacterized protein n=1 Tax=viral metagenome TaxID=1070528 RepID=A0A6M3L052_9ZZZZ